MNAPSAGVSNRRVRIETAGCPCCRSDLLLIEKAVGVGDPVTWELLRWRCARDCTLRLADPPEG